MSSSLITPNFSADSLGNHTDYLNQLSVKYATLSKLLLEERLSESHSPHSEANEGRILALRERIQEAWSRADGNPASGKWALLTRLLRMGVTSGRGGKWVGARADVKSPDCPDNGSGWLCTTSESDWMEWERKFIQDQMVVTWKKGVELNGRSRATTSQLDPMPHLATKDLRRPGSSRSRVGSGVASDKKLSLGPLQDSAPFGFGVVKRSSQTNVLNGKPHTGSKMPYAVPELPVVSEVPESSKGADKSSLMDLSPIHPSFSGAPLLTSTPKQTAKPTTTSLMARSELSSPLTPLISSPSKRALLGRPSSLASPPVPRKVGQNDLSKRSPPNRGVANSSSLPAIPTLQSPLRHTNSLSPDDDDDDRNDVMTNTNNKRILSSSHSYPVTEADGRKSKKAKTISSNHDVNPPPQTPPRDHKTAVPTLTELLASAKKTKKKRSSGVKPHTPQKREFDHKHHSFTSEPRIPAQGSGDGEESIPVEIAEEELPPFFDPSPVDDGGGGGGCSSGNIRESDDHAAEAHQPEYDFYSHLNDFNLPAKSLSPIDGEEEEEAAGGEIDEFILDSSFRPLATSTQVQDDQRRRGTYVSKSNLNGPVITQPDDPPRPSAKGKNAADSWESIYALPGPSASSVSVKNDTLFPQLSCNSQIESDLAAQVEKVNKLLQQDVDYDELLCGTPLNDQERDEGDDSGDSILNGGRSGLVKDGHIYGYGKAFEYDQSF